MATPLSRAQIDSKLADIPAGGDRELYDKLFEVKRDASGNIKHVNPPMFMTADEIMRTHGLIGEYAGENPTNASRADVVAGKYHETFDTSYKNGWNEHTYNPGVGTGSGVADSIEKHGYNWNKPIPLGIKGLEDDFSGKEDYPEPMVANGQHRLAYMWMHHPDTMMPVDAQIHQDVHNPAELGHIKNYIAGRASTALTREKLGDI